MATTNLSQILRQRRQHERGHILNVTIKWCSVITERQALAFLKTSKQGGPKAMQAMAKKTNTNRRDALEKLVKAAGGKVVAMYGTMVDGPGAMAIVDVDPGVGAAVAAVIASSDGVCNVKTQRLFSMDEVIGIRKKRIQLQKSYSPPGQ